MYEEKQLIIRSGPLTGIVSLLSRLNYFSSASSTSFRPGVRNCVILELFCSNPLKILVLFFQIFGSLNLRVKISDLRQLSFFFFFIFCITLTF